MLRVALLLLCIFVAATHAQFPLKGNDIPLTHKFPGFIVLRGSHLFKRIGDTSGCPVKPWSDAQSTARTRRLYVNFTAPFEEPPLVTYTLTRLDMTARFNVRYNVDLISVSTTAFILDYGVWCNTFSASTRVTFWVSGVPSKAASQNSAVPLSYVATESTPLQFSLK